MKQQDNNNKCYSCLKCWLLFMFKQHSSFIFLCIGIFLPAFSDLTHIKHYLSTIFSFPYFPPEDAIVSDTLNKTDNRRDGTSWAAIK